MKATIIIIYIFGAIATWLFSQEAEVEGLTKTQKIAVPIINAVFFPVFWLVLLIFVVVERIKYGNNKRA